MSETRLTDEERESLARVIQTHKSARAVPLGDGGAGWTCEGCGQPLSATVNPGAAFDQLTVHQAVMLDDLIEAILAARLAKVEALADEFDSEVDWSPGRWDYGDNRAWESAARRLRAALSPGATS